MHSTRVLAFTVATAWVVTGCYERGVVPSPHAPIPKIALKDTPATNEMDPTMGSAGPMSGNVRSAQEAMETRKQAILDSARAEVERKRAAAAANSGDDAKNEAGTEKPSEGNSPKSDSPAQPKTDPSNPTDTAAKKPQVPAESTQPR